MTRLLGRSHQGKPSCTSTGTATGTPPGGRVPSLARIPSDEQQRRSRWHSAANLRSLAGQVFVLQVIIVLLLAAAAVGEVILQTRHDTTTEARNRSLAVAQTFANSPGIVAALHSPNPTAILQPDAEAARKLTGVDFIVVTNTQGIRYTHPIRNRIGKKFVGNIGPPLAGHPVTENIKGTIGPLVQANVPVFDPHHKVVGIVSAGVTINKIGATVNRQMPVLFTGAAVAVLLAAGGTALVSRRLRRQTHGLEPAEMTRMYEHHDAVLHAVKEGVIIVGGDGRLLLANDEAARLLGLPPDAEGRLVTELGLEERAATLLASGRVVTDEVLPSGDRLLAVNNRPTDRNGGPPGSVATLRDTTELRVLSSKADAARRRLKLLYDASVCIGTTLDVTRTAEELAQVAVPGFADFVTVDLAEPVLRGEEPARRDGTEMRRVAVGGIRDDFPFYPVGRRFAFAPATPQAAGLGSGRAVLAPRLDDVPGWRTQDPERTKRIIDYGIHSLITVPLRARGDILGMVNFWRSQKPEPFESDDLSLAEELVARAAVCIDNARRYTREHTMAVTLQRSLLPRGLPEQSALDVAYRYLPAQAGVGGDWFDVIPLPGARVALVVGDVVGHGLHAAATMGRLRTAVHNFSALDLPPDELLGHLDELIGRIDTDEAAAGGELSVAGATCLYAIYDPVARQCVLSRAGHPPPALVHPDGRVEFPELPAGLPLGLGSLPFETAEWHVPEGSQLVLYTDGLIEDRDRDIDVGFGLLRESLSRAGRSPEETCAAVLDAMLPDRQSRQSDDIALLVARTRGLQPNQVAEWDVPSDPAAVAGVRADVTRRLSEWGLDEVAFTTELILSELITNAIRYTNGPIQVRLLRDRTLICEVSDSSNTSPHLRYAATTDEGGRGLFLVAQLADRWGTRYTSAGKVIWTEQFLP
ncbi:SpoIIE family protein phosphatase [Streptomyces sp. RB6PN25]|uniref:SpoIIE family protein phosphatase n=1 Tax=Streptomyces humicola TaxID=2953240 RepID=A0ABT1Q4X2_9ACTN|nr:SpoIIE family protein phosphatase/ATP-binding protein [Streptomyces humicola]MCQ4084973.1 SpoIIE family protein phosphatase [Streptomyces humicola]